MPTKTSPVTLGGGYRSRLTNESVPNADWSYSNYILQTTENVTTGGNLPNWKKRIKHGLGATTSLNGVKRRSHVEPGSFLDVTQRNILSPTVWTRRQIEGALGVEFLSHPSAPSGAPLAKVNTAALTKFVQRAIALQRKMQGGVFIGEIREVVHMIRNPFKLLYKGQYTQMSNLLSGRRLLGRGASLSSLRRLVADTWLESVFGWQPLIKDIDDGVRALAELSTKHPDSQVVHGKASDKTQTSPSNFSSVVCFGTVPFTLFSVDEVAVKYHGSIWVDAPGDLSGAHTFGVSLSDLLPTAWELIPWSFLVDYFTNLGDIIEALSFNTSRVRWIEKGTRSSRKTFVIVGPWTQSTPSPGYKLEVAFSRSGGTHTSEWTEVSRNDYTGQSLIPDFRFEIPGIGSRKWLNILALAATHRSSSQAYYRR